MRQFLLRLFDAFADLSGPTPSPMASLDRSIAATAWPGSATLAETIRDLHETNRMINRIEQARTEKLLGADRN